MSETKGANNVIVSCLLVYLRLNVNVLTINVVVDFVIDILLSPKKPTTDDVTMILLNDHRNRNTVPLLPQYHLWLLKLNEVSV